MSLSPTNEHHSPLNSTQITSLQAQNNYNELKISLACGSLGGVISVLASHPLDTIKVRMQTFHKGLIDSISTLIKRDGFKGLYKGIQSPLYNISLISAIDFAAFEYGKHLQGLSSNEPVTAIQSFKAGALSGVVSAIITNPVELVKCKMQISKKQIAARQVLRQIVKNEGIRGLYKGITSCLIRDIKGVGVYFATYSVAKREIAQNMDSESYLPSMIAGGLAGILGWISCYPFDVIKTKIQCEQAEGIGYFEKKQIMPKKRKNRSGGITYNVAREIYQKNGVLGFTKGLSACLLKTSVASSTCFYAYEWARVNIFKTGQSY